MSSTKSSANNQRGADTTYDAEIIRLRQAGEFNREIADRLGLSYPHLCEITSRLVQASRLPDARGRRRSTVLKLEKYGERIIRFHQARRPIAFVAKRLGLKYPQIYRIARVLVRQGRLPHARFGSGAYSEERRKEIADTVIEMTQQGAMLGEIGRRLNLSRERIRQWRQQIEAERGPIVSGSYLTTAEVAVRAGATRNFVNKLVAHEKLKVARRMGQRHLFLPDAVETVRQAYKTRKHRVCRVCGRTFRALEVSQALCGSVCRRLRNRMRHGQLLAKPASEDSLIGWRLQLWKRLRTQPLTSREEWLANGEACRLSGLSPMQILYLGRRGVFNTRSHPSKKNIKGQPIRLYAASQVALAGRLARQEQAQQRKRQSSSSG